MFSFCGWGCCFHVICNEDVEHTPAMLYLTVAWCQCCLSTMISPFPKHCEQAALPHPLFVEVYFSEVMCLKFLVNCVVYFCITSLLCQFSGFSPLQLLCLQRMSVHAKSVAL